MSAPEPHLLIVDDDERIRGLLQKYLMRAGFLVTAARDAASRRGSRRSARSSGGPWMDARTRRPC